MDKNIKIRQVQLQDLDSITRLESIGFPEAEAATKESFAYRIKTFPESFYIAEYDHEIIGLINGCVTDSNVICDDLYEANGGHNPNGKNQTVFGLVVHPSYQRQGIAEKLMKHFIKISKEAGREKMVLTCKEHLIDYYERFGYVNQGVSQSTHGGTVWYDMVAEI